MTKGKNFFKSLDSDHASRIEDVEEDFVEMDDIRDVPIEKIFHSDAFPDQFDKDLSYFQGFSEEGNLCMNVPFTEREVVFICPRCKCVKNTDLIEPFLSRNIVIPILAQQYQAYEEDFLNTILRYPHVNFHEFRLYKSLSLQLGLKRPPFCPDCWQKRKREVKKEYQKLLSDLNPDLKDKIKFNKELVMSRTMIPFSSERKILNIFKQGLKEKNFKLIQNTGIIADSLFKIRNAQSLQATPQLSIKNIKKLKKDLPTKNFTVNETTWEEKVLDGLKISYDPSISLENYLDVVKSRREHIRKKCREILEKGQDSNKKELIKIQEEIEKINEEIRELKSSKSKEIVTGITNFLSENSILLSGIMVGGLLGGSISLSGGVAGATGGGISSGALQSLGDFQLPEEIEKKGQAYQDKFLSIILDTDIETIQIWRTRKDLSQAEKLE